MASPVSLRFEDGIAILTMQNDKNQLDIDFLQQLHHALEQVISNPDAKALITTAEGKNYSQGIHLAWYAQQDEETTKRFWFTFNDFLCRLLTMPIPTVAAINGHAFAGGAFIALAHDYIVMNTDKGWFSFNEVFLSMRIPVFLLELIRYKLASGRLQTDVIMMGKRLTGKEALEAGLARRACPRDKLMTQAKEVVAECLRLGDIPRLGMEEMKKDLYWPVIKLSRTYNMLERSKL